MKTMKKLWRVVVLILGFLFFAGILNMIFGAMLSFSGMSIMDLDDEARLFWLGLILVSAFLLTRKYV